MKSSDNFKAVIQANLEKECALDSLFAEHFKKETKNIDDCITYILNYVKNSGINGFADSEIYSLAKHYYIEDNIEIGPGVDCNVIVNHSIELTEEEKNKMIEKAKTDVYNKQVEKMTTKPAPTKPIEVKTTVPQQSLF